MIVYRNRADLSQHLASLRTGGKFIGLVPTMGALHAGHLSLVERAISENDSTVVSIFVNPTQFNDPKDLENYPRTLDNDLEMLRTRDVDVVFVPPVKEMYPVEDQRTFDLGGLDLGMEGRFRKGHFNGVAQIVSKLFEAVMPHAAYFGEKDFQQLAIVRHLVRVLGLDIRIVGCPVVRESDGLAMSSRNVLLSKEERKAAPFIFRTLKKAKEKAGKVGPSELEHWVLDQFSGQALLEPEYFEIVDDTSLQRVHDWKKKGGKVGCIAVNVGNVRLIDNLKFD